MHERRLLDAFEDDGRALLGFQHHMRGFQLLRHNRQSAWPRSCLPTGSDGRACALPLETPAKLNGTTSPSKVQRMECSGRTQRTARPGFQRIDLGQGSLAITSGRISASTCGGLAALALDHRHIDIALGRLLDLELVLGQAGLFQKAVERRLRRVGLGAFQFLAHIALLGGQAGNRQASDAAGRRKP